MYHPTGLAAVLAAVVAVAPDAQASAPRGLYAISSNVIVFDAASPLVRISPDNGDFTVIGETATELNLGFVVQGIDYNAASGKLIIAEPGFVGGSGDFLGALFEIDPVTRASTRIAGLPFLPERLARNPVTGSYFLTERGTFNLYEVSPDTFDVTFVGDLGALTVGITFEGDGTLFGVQRPDLDLNQQLVTIDTTDADITAIGGLGATDTRIRGIAFDTQTDTIYVSGGSTGGTGQNRLLSIDPAAGLSGDITVINDDFGSGDYRGLAFAVPTPATAPLVGLGAWIATRRRRVCTA